MILKKMLRHRKHCLLYCVYIWFQKNGRNPNGCFSRETVFPNNCMGAYGAVGYVVCSSRVHVSGIELPRKNGLSQNDINLPHQQQQQPNFGRHHNTIIYNSINIVEFRTTRSTAAVRGGTSQPPLFEIKRCRLLYVRKYAGLG